MSASTAAPNRTETAAPAVDHASSSLVARLWRSFAGTGSATQLSVFRALLAAHLLTVFTSPALPLLQRIDAHPHVMTGTLLPSALEAALSWQHVVLLANVGAIAAIAMALGLFTRLAIGVVLVTFVLTQNAWFRATAYHDDWLYFVFPLLALLLSRCADAWSLDAKLGRTKPLAGMERSAYRWPVAAMLCWFSFLYFAAGLAKLLPLRKGIAWLSGRSVQWFAIEFVRDSPVYWLTGASLFDYRILWPFTLGAFSTVALELGAVSLPWLSPGRRLMLFTALVAMHAVIHSLGVPSFVQIALVFAVLLLPPEAFRDAKDDVVQTPATPSQPSASATATPSDPAADA